MPFINLDIDSYSRHDALDFTPEMEPDLNDCKILTPVTARVDPT